MNLSVTGSAECGWVPLPLTSMSLKVDFPLPHLPVRTIVNDLVVAVSVASLC